MSNLKKLLDELLDVDGINTAVIVGRDGFVMEGASNGKSIDQEAVGAVISTGIGATEVMGRELDVGDITQGMLEYKNGIIVTGFLGSEAILAIVADLKANLGNVRHQVKKYTPEIERAL